MSHDLEICIDKILPVELESLAREAAIQENPANEIPSSSPFEMAVEVRYLWRPGTTLSVRFLGGSPLVQEKVEHYAHQWEKYANIHFNFIKNGPAQIRIAFTRGDGSWSYIGTQAQVIAAAQPTMNFGWLEDTSPEEKFARVVLHEFGHALGCIHEHQHPDHGIQWNKPKTYDYYRRKGWSQAEVDIQVFQKYSRLQTQFSSFDPQSIMIYPIPSEITLDGFSVDWNRELSDTDKAFIGQMYPFSIT